MILVGDIGGTNARLGLFELSGARLRVIAAETYPSRQRASLEEIVELFMARQQGAPARACFAIAGPVSDGRAVAANLSWVVDAQRLGKIVGLPDVGLINDLEAIAYGLDELEDSDVAVLHPGTPGAEGNRAIIAAGTGLGEAGAYWDGHQHHPFACEGGHTDFGPRTPGEMELLTWLRARFDRVSYERVLSGSGLYEVYEFLRDRSRREEPSWLSEELARHPAPAVIVQHALDGLSELLRGGQPVRVDLRGRSGEPCAQGHGSRRRLDRRRDCSKNPPTDARAAFREAFVAKGPMRPLLEGMWVGLILKDRVGLLGAARYALQ